MGLLVVDVADLVGHSPSQNHRPGKAAGLLDVARRAVGDVVRAVFDDLRRLAGHGHGELLLALRLVQVELVDVGQADHHSQRDATRDDRGLVDVVAFGKGHADDCVPGLVVGGHLLLLVGQHHRAAFGAHEHLVLRALELLHRHEPLANPRGEKRGLVDKIGEIGAGESRRAARNDPQIDVGAKRRLCRMHPEDGLAALDVGIRHGDLPVEASRAQQRRIEHVLAVGGRDDDDALVFVEAVHLDEKLVERLLALVVSAAPAGAAVAAHRVDLVDEEDARRILLGLLEHVADARGADADEHLDEVGARNGEERNPRLAGDGPRKQGLAGARRPDQERARRNPAAEPAELLRVAQELDDFLHLLLGLVDSRHVVEGDPALPLGQHPRLGLAEAHCAAAASALHLVHEVDPDPDEQQDRNERNQEGHEARLLLRLGDDGNAVLDEKVGDRGVGGLHRRVFLPVGSPEADTLAIKRDLADRPAFGGGHEVGVAHQAALGRHAVAEQVEQRDRHDDQRRPEEHALQTEISQYRSPQGPAQRIGPPSTEI